MASSLRRQKGSIRYYSKTGVDKLIRLDYHGSKEVPTGTCNAILKAAGLSGRNIRLNSLPLSITTATHVKYADILN